jgi:hypothetical protein
MSSGGYVPGPAGTEDRGGGEIFAPSKDGTGGREGLDFVGAFSLFDVAEPWLDCPSGVDRGVPSDGGSGGSEGVGNWERTI